MPFLLTFSVVKSIVSSMLLPLVSVRAVGINRFTCNPSLRNVVVERSIAQRASAMTSLRGQLAMSVYVGSLMLVALGNALAFLFFSSPLSILFFIAQVLAHSLDVRLPFLADILQATSNRPGTNVLIWRCVQAVLLLLPLGKTPTWGHRLNKYALRSYTEWTDFKVIYEVSGFGGSVPAAPLS